MAVIIKGDFSKSRKEKTEVREKQEKPAPIYQLNISLSYSDPLIWRRIQVPGDFTLAQLHEVLRLLMGWSGEQMHQFYVGKIFYQMPPEGEDVQESKRYDESKFTLHDLEEAMKWCCIYLYDAGEGWEHQVEMEEIIPAGKGEKYPLLLTGERAAPPEKFEGIQAYETFLNTLGDQENSQLHGTRGGTSMDDFDPDFLDKEALNAKLRELALCLLH